MKRKFEIISKKNLPDEAHIKGFTFLKESSDKDKEKNKYDFVSKSTGNEIGCMLNKRNSYATTKGYVRVDGTVNDYIEVKSRFFIIPIIFVLVLLCGLIAFLLSSKPAEVPVVNDDPYGDYETSGERIEREDEEPVVKNEGTITFSGFGKYTVTEKNPSVELKNSAKNTVDFMFTMTDKATGEVIAKTKKVRPGEYVYVDVVKFYKEPGVYTILIQTSTYDEESGQQMNGMNQEMEVTVK